jgi:hypothetical protein
MAEAYLLTGFGCLELFAVKEAEMSPFDASPSLRTST